MKSTNGRWHFCSSDEAADDQVAKRRDLQRRTDRVRSRRRNPDEPPAGRRNHQRGGERGEGGRRWWGYGRAAVADGSNGVADTSVDDDNLAARQRAASAALRVGRSCDVRCPSGSLRQRGIENTALIPVKKKEVGEEWFLGLRWQACMLVCVLLLK